MMRKPLSYGMYFKSHKKSSLAIMISIGLAILLIGAIQLYTFNMNDSDARNNEKYKYATLVYKNKKALDKAVIKKLENEASVERVVKVESFRYMIRSVFGTDADYEGFYADENDIKYMINKMGLKFDKGSYIKNGDKKILINENTARCKNASIGSFVGYDVRRDDYFPGKYKVNGILKGDNIVSFIAVDSKALEKENYMCFVFPKKGKMKEMNKYINSISKDGIKNSNYESLQKEEINNLNGFNTIFNLVIIIMIVVMSTVLGNSSYISYMRRRPEIGILKAMGYTKEKIVLRMVKEIAISSLFGFGFGYLALFVFAKIYNVLYLYPRGIALFLITWDLFPKLLSIPLFIAIFSIIPVSRLLEKVEPISIIERMG